MVLKLTLDAEAGTVRVESSNRKINRLRRWNPMDSEELPKFLKLIETLGGDTTQRTFYFYAVFFGKTNFKLTALAPQQRW